MSKLVLKEEDFILLHTLHGMIAKKSLRQFLLSQLVVCSIGLYGTAFEMILQDVWSYCGANMDQSITGRTNKSIPEFQGIVHWLTLLITFLYFCINKNMLSLDCFLELLRYEVIIVTQFYINGKIN